MQQSQTQVLITKIDEGNLKEALQLALQINQVGGVSPALQITLAILQIKNDDAKAALETIGAIQKPIPQQILQSYQQVWSYGNYKVGNYGIVTKDLKERGANSSFEGLLLAQSLGKEEKYEEMVDLYIKLLPNCEQEQEMFANIISGAISSENQQLMEKVNRFSIDYAKKQKGLISRDILINHSLLLAIMKEYSESRDLINRVINLIKLDAQSDADLDMDEDYLMSLITIDYVDYKQKRVSVIETEEKLKQYLNLLNKPGLPQHITAVILNNLACIQESLHHNTSDTLKRIEESLDQLVTGKNFPLQLSNARINRIIIQFSRNRLADGIKNLKEIEQKIRDPYVCMLLRLIQALKSNNSYQQLLLDTLKVCPDQMTAVYTVLLITNEQPQIAPQIINDIVRVVFPQWAQHKPLALLTLAAMLKNNKPIPILLQEIEKAGLLPDLASYYLNSNQIDEAMRLHQILSQLNHPSAQYIHGRIALKYIELNQWSKAEGFLDQIQFPFQTSTDTQELERLESNVQLTKATRSKSQDLTQVVQKSIKKKHRSRRPKNLPLDAPPPNPERWLPKQERKEYRKRKGQMKSRTQGSSAPSGNKETMSVFVKGASTANVDVSSKKQKNQKKKH